MPLGDLEDLVRTALECGLIGPEARRTLMRGLPMGFVYSLPTVSRPIDQLRFDLMELERTPRLIGLDRPPLAVWLSNAADKTATEGKADAARIFAARADAIYPSAGVAQRIEKQLGQMSPSATPATASSAPTVSSTSNARSPETGAPARAHVLTLDSVEGEPWKRVDPPIDPIKIRRVSLPTGDWARIRPPYTSPWRQVREAIDEQLGKLADGVGSGEALEVFVRDAPPVIAMLLASRLRQRIRNAELRCWEAVHSDGRTVWRPRGPVWRPPVTAADEPVLDVTMVGVKPDTHEVALVIQVTRPIGPASIASALPETDAVPRLVLSHRPRPRRGAIESPRAIQRAVRDVTRAMDDLLAVAPDLRRIHLFYRGPGLLAARLSTEVLEYEIPVTAYARQDDGFVPAIALTRTGEATLVRRADRDAARGEGYDVFVAYARADEEIAEALYEALVEDAGLHVFLDRRSLLPGDVWDTAIPGAIADSRVVVALLSPVDDSAGEAWYQKEELIHGIRYTRRNQESRRLVPVLLNGLERDELPYGLGRLTTIGPCSGTPAGIGTRITQALRPVLSLPDTPGSVDRTWVQPDEPAETASGSDAPSPASREPAPERSGPLKVLFIAADPGRSDRQVVSDEMRHIEEAIRRNGRRDAVVLASRHGLRHDDLIRALREEKPDILHIAGHGDERGVHLIDPQTSRAVALGAESLARILRLFDHLRGVVLTIPHSAAIADALVDTVDFAIGIEGVPSDKARRDLAGAFYDAVSAGDSIARAFGMGEAMFLSRHDATGQPCLASKGERADLEALTLVVD